MTNLIEQVRDFQHKFGLPIHNKPAFCSPQYLEFRLNHIDEELLELRKAVAYRDMERTLDAVCDLLYVIFGFAINNGLPVIEAFELVHKANMKKVLHHAPAAAIAHGGKDIIKPEGWTAPNLLGVLNTARCKLNYTFYIASGWFNPRQAADLETILSILDAERAFFRDESDCEPSVTWYSPRDENECPPDATEEVKNAVYNANLRAIRLSEFVIVNTRDKDLGTIFEAGYAIGNSKKIIYYCEGLQGQFNLMLAKSGICVCTSPTQLKAAIHEVLKDRTWTQPYNGVIE